MSTIRIGDIARDPITGFEGTVIGRSEWLHNVDTLIIQAPGQHDGKSVPPRSFDRPRLELVASKNRAELTPPARGFELGDTLRDETTGFEGVAVGRTLWLTGCDRWALLAKKLHNGAPIDPETCDGLSLVLVEKAPHKDAAIRLTPETGGPMPEPARR